MFKGVNSGSVGSAGQGGNAGGGAYHAVPGNGGSGIVLVAVLTNP